MNNALSVGTLTSDRQSVFTVAVQRKTGGEKSPNADGRRAEYDQLN